MASSFNKQDAETWETEDGSTRRFRGDCGGAGQRGAGIFRSGCRPPSPDTLIIQAKDHAELKEKFCAANPNVEHIFVLPASLFVDSEQLICDGGPYKLYRLIEHDDPDDLRILSGSAVANKTRLGCDGKAGKNHADDRLQLPAIEVNRRGPDAAAVISRRRGACPDSIPIGARRSNAWPCSALPAWSPVSCRSGPRARPILPPASSISARAWIGAGTSHLRWPPRR